MQEKKILVTGAGGFIGSHMAQKLFQDGIFIRVVDIKWDGYLKEPYYNEKFTLDLRNYDNCVKATKGIDYIFHFAAECLRWYYPCGYHVRSHLALETG